MANRTGIHPSRNKLYNAGMSFRDVRSPVPPKIKNSVPSATGDVVDFMTFAVSADT
jgi:hypothetical protein